MFACLVVPEQCTSVREGVYHVACVEARADIVSPKRKQNQKCSCFRALGNQFEVHVFPGFANTFLFSRAWSVTQKM